MGAIPMDEVPLAILDDIPLVAYRVWGIMGIRCANPPGVEIRSQEPTEGKVRGNREIALPLVQPSHGVAMPIHVIDESPLGPPLLVQNLRVCNQRPLILGVFQCPTG